LRYPDKKLWEHKKSITFGYYYENDEWYFFKINKYDSLRPKIEDPKIIREPVLRYLIPYIYKKRLFDTFHASSDIYPGYTSLCTLKSNNGQISAATPSLFLESAPDPDMTLTQKFLNYWANNTAAEGMIRKWDQSDGPAKYFFNVINEYTPLVINLGVGSIKKPNIIIKVKASCWTNLKSYISGSVRFGHGLLDSPGHQQFVLYKNVAWKLDDICDLDIIDTKNKLHPILKSERTLKKISEVCENDKKKAIGIIGVPSSGKEVVKDIIRFGKSHYFDFSKYFGLSIGGMNTSDVMKQLCGSINTQGIAYGIIEEIDGGSLFIDEIGKGNKNIRSGLLRILEADEFIPIGGTKRRPIDRLLFICTTTPEDRKGAGLNPIDFWTRVEPCIEPVNIVEREHEGRLNVTLKLWIDIVENMIDVKLINEDSNITNMEKNTKYEKTELKIAKSIYRNWVGEITYPGENKIEYTVGPKLKHNFKDMIKETKKFSNPREIRNYLGSFYSKYVIRRNG